MLLAGSAVGAGSVAFAQGTPPDSIRTTLDGVYSTTQAARGRDTFTESCLECHSAAEHSGRSFQNSWMGHLLSDLLQYIRDKMPKSNPGSLTTEQYTDITAFILSINGLPSGEQDLPADSLALRRIRIEIPKAAGGLESLGWAPPSVPAHSVRSSSVSSTNARTLP